MRHVIGGGEPGGLGGQLLWIPGEEQAEIW